MSSAPAQPIFVCSFCSRGIRFQPQQIGLRVHCPACKRVVQLFPNQHDVIDEHLTSRWSYRKLRLLFGEKEIGPIVDAEFLSRARQGEICSDTEVCSPEATQNQWVTFGQVNVALLQERIDQRAAEQRRREQWIERQRTIDKENRDKLRQAIRTFLADGVFTSNEQQAVRQFAAATAISDAEVQHFLTEESVKLVREVFDEALSDGILDTYEEQRINQLAAALGVSLQVSHEDYRRMDLCRLAYQLNSRAFVPVIDREVPIKLAANETAAAVADVTWHEVVTTKRATVPLGDGRYLKQVGAGAAFLTDRQIVMLGALDAKKIALSSVQHASRYSDGVFLNRSSGKSVFLAVDSRSLAGGRFSLITEYACSGQPVLGIDPTSRFVPDIFDAQVVEYASINLVDNDGLATNGDAPRYTFRVVGDHIGHRAAYISRLRPGWPLWMIREPTNPVDENAVAVYDQDSNQLGYLKREVAEWFAPILDRGKRFTASVHTLTSTGSLIVAVFE